MTDKLPPNLLALFAPRPPLRYLPPSDHAPEQRKTANIDGVGQYLQALKEYDDHYVPTESWLQRKDRLKQEKKEKVAKTLTDGVANFKPADDPNVKGDPFRTLFVARLSYDVEPKDLEREFGRFGPIERIRLVQDTTAPEDAPKKKKNRGYAFIVYEREKDMKAAYKETDGIRIKDRKVLVDVERGRTVSGWRPRRLGGGLGGRGYTKAVPARPSGPGFGPPAGPGGFSRGGFGGGMRGGRGGYRGGFDRGGFRGGYGGRSGGGDRGGYQSNGWGGGAPEGAPAGPRGRSGGFGSGGYGGRDGGHGGGSRFDDRDRGASGSNREPVGSRREHGGYRDRDRDGGYGRDSRDDYPRKRGYEGGDSYGDSRSKRRY
ncbi:U1 small nuclear ribonucleoprotein 70 kDa [Phyllosticta citrichinensis]|uniref:U1 small nuclear ribonucleoprotein 70 kDa n=1 Tax=Phyllosticta citrichinensis TaxID=1130410 RepID=A0ABR1XJR3_9PEZI